MIKHLRLRPQGGATLQTMASRRDGDTVTITYLRGYESRRKAAALARQYAVDTLRDVRAAFVDSDIGESGDQTVVTYVYRLVSR